MNTVKLHLFQFCRDHCRAVYDVYAGGITHCDAQNSGQTMEDVTSLDSSSIDVYAITDDCAGDCADASEVYGA